MNKTEYYEILRQGLPDTLSVRELIHGISWTAAVLLLQVSRRVISSLP